MKPEDNSTAEPSTARAGDRQPECPHASILACFQDKAASVFQAQSRLFFRGKQRPAARFGLAVLIAVLAAVATAYIPVAADRSVFLFFAFAILQTALWLGFQPAILAIAVSVVLANPLFLSTEWDVAPHRALALNLIFSALSVFIAATAYLYRRSLLKLQESREELNRAQTLARTGNWRWRVHGNEFCLTAEARRIFAIPEDAAPTRESLCRALHPDDRNSVEQAWQAALHGAPYDIDYRILAGTEVKWIRELAEPDFGADGSLFGGLGTVQDITDHIQGRTAVREAQADLCRAQAMGHIGCWRMDVRRNDLTWSEENHRIFGIPKGGQINYASFLSCVHPEDREYVDRMWQAALRGVPYDIEHRLIVDGALKWVREKAELEYDEKGELLGGFGITQDITERKKAELALQKAEEKLRNILEAAAVIAWEVDVGNDQVRSIGPVAGFFGGSEDSGFSHVSDFLRHIHPDDRGRVEADLQAAIRGEKPYHIEFRIPLPDGGVRWACAEGEVQWDGEGQPLRVLGVTHDVTALKRSDAALRESEARFRLAAEATDVGLWERNLVTGAVYFSPEWKRQIGHGADEPPEQWAEWENRLHPEDRDRVLSATADYLAGRLASYDMEFRLLHRDGTYRWIHSRGALLRDPQGRAERLLGLNMDISEHKKAQEVRQRLDEMEELSRFHVANQTAAAIAHELHQPLTAISSYSEVALLLLQAGNPEPDKLVHALENNVKQALRAGQVTRQLTALLKKGELVSAAMDLEGSLREAVAIVKERGYPRHHEIVLDIAGDLPQVQADRLQVEKVLVNLLSNALEAMGDGRFPAGLISVSARVEETGDAPMAVVTVRDAGKGLDMENRASIFHPFYTTKAGGLGMGLAISRTLIEANGGKLWAEPDTSPGACFKFTLPLAAASLDSAPAT